MRFRSTVFAMTVVFGIFACCMLCWTPALAQQAEPARAAERINQLDNEGFSKLHRATMGGNVDAIVELIKRGADVEVKQGTFFGRPLQYAASGGHAEAASVLLKADAQIDSKDSRGRTPLMWAAQKSRVEVAELLAKNGANVNAKTKNGWTPLKYAMQAESQPIIDLFIRHGAKMPPAKDPNKPKTNPLTGLPPYPFVARTAQARNEDDSNSDVKWEDLFESKLKVRVRTTDGLTKVKNGKLVIPIEVFNNSGKKIRTFVSHERSGDDAQTGDIVHTNLFASLLSNSLPARLQSVPVYVTKSDENKSGRLKLRPGQKRSFDLRLDLPVPGSETGNVMLRADQHGGYQLQLLLVFDSEKQSQYVLSAPIPITNLGGKMPELQMDSIRRGQKMRSGN